LRATALSALDRVRSRIDHPAAEASGTSASRARRPRDESRAHPLHANDIERRSDMSRLVTLLFALCAQTALTGSGIAQTQRVHGVLSNRPVESFCTIFEADDGRDFILGTTGNFQLGDRIYVEGTIPNGMAGVCNEVAYPFLNNTVTRAGFAGIGTVVRQ